MDLTEDLALLPESHHQGRSAEHRTDQRDVLRGDLTRDSQGDVSGYRDRDEGDLAHELNRLVDQFAFVLTPEPPDIFV